MLLRLLLALPLLLAGCAPSGDPASNHAVDINAAAEAARTDVANHASAATAEGNTPAVLRIPAASPAAVEPAEPGTPNGLPDDGPVSEGKFTPTARKARPMSRRPILR